LLRLVRSAKGAVSVFLIIIFVPIFLFTTLFIDFARIKASELETEQALRAGVRSVLSAYHPELQQWGLFGLGVESEEARKIFNQVMIENLQAASGADYFTYLDTQLKADSAQLTPMYMLSNHTVFERQVLEEMKYRAPIEFALEITDKLQKPTTISTMQSGSTFSKNAAKLEKLIDKREEALDSAWSRTDDLNVRINQAYPYYTEKINQLQDLASKIGTETASSLQAQLESLDQADGDASKEEKESREQERERIRQILAWIGEYTSILAEIKLRAEFDYRLMLDIQKDVDKHIQTAKTTNDEIVIELDRIKKETGPNNSLGVNEVFNHVLIRDHAYLNSFQSGIASVAALFAGFRNDLGGIYLYNEANYIKAIASNDAYYTQNQSYYGQQSVIENKRQQDNDNVRGQKKERRKEIQSVLTQAQKTLMSSCVVGSEAATRKVYSQLEGDDKNKQDGLYNKYLQLNQVQGAGDNGVSFGLEGADKTTTSSMDLIGSLADMLLSARDELYLNEYVLTKYNYRTFGMEQKPSGELKKERTLNTPAMHTLFNQEVEYMIYGFSSCGANLSSAYGEMFAIRFAIRTIEELLEPENKLLGVGSPLLVLLTAAAEGAVKAYADMEELIQGKAVPISSKITSPVFTFTYKDYLRLFLFLHSNDQKLMSRMQALIELNTDVDLANVPTYIEGEAAASTSLWFTSGLFKLFQLTGNSQCVVSGNRCEVVKSAVISY
jgi:hypothetical protein